jgi:hypothetical protein
LHFSKADDLRLQVALAWAIIGGKQTGRKPMAAKSKDYIGKHRNQVLYRVGENLYRSIQNDRYYALFERAGQQYRRSLKTTDRKLAERRLADLRTQIGDLKSDPSLRNIGFIEYAKRWIEIHGAGLKASAKRRRIGQCTNSPFISAEIFSGSSHCGQCNVVVLGIAVNE